MLLRSGFHLSGKEAAVLRKVDSGVGSIFYLKVRTQFDFCFSVQINFAKYQIYLVSTATYQLVYAFLCIYLEKVTTLSK